MVLKFPSEDGQLLLFPENFTRNDCIGRLQLWNFFTVNTAYSNVTAVLFSVTENYLKSFDWWIHRSVLRKKMGQMNIVILPYLFERGKSPCIYVRRVFTTGRGQMVLFCKNHTLLWDIHNKLTFQFEKFC